MKRTTMFRENKPLGHKHILRVDCMNDKQALIMQQRIGIVKIHEILFKICWNRYVTSLEQIRYPIALLIWTKGNLTDDRVFTYLLLIIEDISHYKTYVLFKLLYIPSWITVTDWYLSSAISLIGKIRHSLQFPSIILPAVSDWRLEYAEYQNMLKLAEYHSKENASNVSVDSLV